MLKIKNFLTAALASMMLLSAVPALANNVVPAPAPAKTLGQDCGKAGDPLCIKPATNTGLGTTDIRITIASIIKVAMSLLGIVAVVIMLIGGFTWMTAGGNDEKVGEAKKWIFAGVIGLAIILSAYALANFAIDNLTSATGFNAGA